MNNWFLLTAGAGYYPEGGAGDWINTFETKEQAESCIKHIQKNILYQTGKNKGKVKRTYSTYQYFKDGHWYDCDWFQIIDLRKWVQNGRDPWLDTPLTPEEIQTIRDSLLKAQQNHGNTKIS